MTDNGKPKYFSLMEQLRSDIMSGAIRPGEKLPSENELSQKYSLSRHTVRKALGILEQDGYVEAFHGRGTYCSENMRHIKNSKNIAVVTTYISDYIFPRLIQGMDNVLSESGYSIILKNTASTEADRIICRVGQRVYSLFPLIKLHVSFSFIRLYGFPAFFFLQHCTTPPFVVSLFL